MARLIPANIPAPYRLDSNPFVKLPPDQRERNHGMDHRKMEGLNRRLKPDVRLEEGEIERGVYVE